MKHQIRMTAGPLAAIALLVFACGGKQTVASKSAEAFREAQQKGPQADGGSHGGHEAGTPGVHDDAATAPTRPAATMTGMDHSTMTAGDQGNMAGMDHSKMQDGQSMAGMDHSKVHGGQSMAGMDHSRMQGGKSMAGMDHSKMQGGQSMAGMDHSKMQSGQSMAGMDHSKMQGSQSMAGIDHSKMQGSQPMAGMDHSNMQKGQPMAGQNNKPRMQHGGAESVASSAPLTSSEIQQTRPADTLRTDSFDAPSPISVAEAKKGPAGGGHEGHQMSGTAAGQNQEMDHGQHDEGRGAEQPRRSSPAVDHSTHGQTPPATPRPKARAGTTGTAPAAATVYACPMHPEVRSDKPAKCPKCGMSLVKKK